MISYVDRKPSYETIELLEESILYETTIKELKQLHGVNHSIANWGRKFAEIELIKTEERFINRLIGTAKERYEHLLKNQTRLS